LKDFQSQCCICRSEERSWESKIWDFAKLQFINLCKLRLLFLNPRNRVKKTILSLECLVLINKKPSLRN